MASGAPLLPASPRPPRPPNREQSQTSLSPKELNVNRSVGLAKDPGEPGKRGDPGLKADPEGSGVMGKDGYLETPTPVTHRSCSPSRCGGSSLGLGCIRVKGSSTATSLKQRPRPGEP